MRKYLTALVTAITIATCGVSGAFEFSAFLRNPDILRKKGYSYVSKVVDGDTIILEDGQKVRYLGIDAPETHRKEGEHWVAVSEPFGEEATKLNRTLVENKQVVLGYDREKQDVYGRTIAYVYADNILINTKLLAEGVVFPYDIHKLKLSTKYKLAFFNALKSGRGLYKNQFLNTKLHEQTGLYGWYRGKINSIYYDTTKSVIKTDYLDIHLTGKKGGRIRGLKPGNTCYFYGKLTRKKDRYILLSENPHHIVVE